ncbi:MAG: hypothetical protein IPJ28_23330 [Betaproteobacteria bacterium]|nr:hypothetical protein [Betaproteobacteria bacterium]
MADDALAGLHHGAREPLGRGALGDVEAQVAGGLVEQQERARLGARDDLGVLDDEVEDSVHRHHGAHGERDPGHRVLLDELRFQAPRLRLELAVHAVDAGGHRAELVQARGVELHVALAARHAPRALEDRFRVVLEAPAELDGDGEGEQDAEAAQEGDLDHHAAVDEPLVLVARHRERHRRARHEREEDEPLHDAARDAFQVLLGVHVAHRALAREVLEHHEFPLREDAAADEPVAREELHVAVDREILVADGVHDEREEAREAPGGEREEVAVPREGARGRRGAEAEVEAFADGDLRHPHEQEVAKQVGNLDAGDERADEAAVDREEGDRREPDGVLVEARRPVDELAQAADGHGGGRGVHGGALASGRNGHCNGDAKGPSGHLPRPGDGPIRG